MGPHQKKKKGRRTIPPCQENRGEQLRTFLQLEINVGVLTLEN